MSSIGTRCRCCCVLWLRRGGLLLLFLIIGERLFGAESIVKGSADEANAPD